MSIFGVISNSPFFACRVAPFSRLRVRRRASAARVVSCLKGGHDQSKEKKGFRLGVGVGGTAVISSSCFFGLVLLCARKTRVCLQGEIGGQKDLDFRLSESYFQATRP